MLDRPRDRPSKGALSAIGLAVMVVVALLAWTVHGGNKNPSEGFNTPSSTTGSGPLSVMRMMPNKTNPVGSFDLEAIRPFLPD